MNTNDIVKQIEQIEKQLKYLKSQFKTTTPNEKELTPLQQAVKTATNSKTEDKDFKKSLEVLYQSPEQLSNKQVAFVLYFGMLNHQDLGEDIDYWFDLELGKRRYNKRSEAIDQIRDIIQQNYKGTDSFKQKIDSYLTSKKK